MNLIALNCTFYLVSSLYLGTILAALGVLGCHDYASRFRTEEYRENQKDDFRIKESLCNGCHEVLIAHNLSNEVLLTVWKPRSLGRTGRIRTSAWVGVIDRGKSVPCCRGVGVSAARLQKVIG